MLTYSKEEEEETIIGLATHSIRPARAYLTAISRVVSITSKFIVLKNNVPIYLKLKNYGKVSAKGFFTKTECLFLGNCGTCNADIRIFRDNFYIF